MIRVMRTARRKNRSTRAAKRPPQRPVALRLSTDSTMCSPWSQKISKSTPCRCGRWPSSSSLARTPREISTRLPPEAFITSIPRAGRPSMRLNHSRFGGLRATSATSPRRRPCSSSMTSRRTWSRDSKRPRERTWIRRPPSRMRPPGRAKLRLASRRPTSYGSTPWPRSRPRSSSTRTCRASSPRTSTVPTPSMRCRTGRTCTSRSWKASANSPSREAPIHMTGQSSWFQRSTWTRSISSGSSGMARSMRSRRSA